MFREKDFTRFCRGEVFSGLTKDAAVLFLDGLAKTTKGKFVLEVKDKKVVFDLYSRCYENSGEVFVFYPSIPKNTSVPGFVPEEKRYQKEAIVSLLSKKPVICIGDTHALSEKNIEKNIDEKVKTFAFSLNDKIALEKVLFSLSEIGYEKEDIVLEPGVFSNKGDVLDVFPHHFKNPVRISFNHDEVEKISLFDPTTQLTVQKLKKLVFKDFFELQTVDNITIKETHPDIEVFYGLIKNEQLTFKPEKPTGETLLNTFNFFPSNYDTKTKIKKIKSYEGVLKRKTLVGTKKVSLEKVPELNASFVFGSIQKSFLIKDSMALFISEHELFTKIDLQSRWQPQTTSKHTLTQGGVLSEIRKGDLMVHRDFGIGCFCGIIEKQEKVGVFEGVEIEYKNNSRVFVSSEQLHLVQRYIGSGKKPALSMLGSKKWSGEIKKTKKAIEEIAKEIVILYSKKTKSRDFLFTKTNDLDGSLSKSFSFIETPDQKKAIQNVYQDMNKQTPMDRLVCGDVGFGKTEVAIRAIFKAFLSDKLSVFLCPTTILADQHYITCSERMGSFGVRIGLLSRFKTPSEQRRTISLLKKKKVDVLIGTHRVLSKDVKLKNLGLLVIDEEHRFGVKHKEKIRSLKNNVDILTMTATPIPRTLQQSLIGLKDLSIIKTPPVSRKPIKTSVSYFNWNSVFQIMTAELNRGGQVYFLNNNIRSISTYVEKIRSFFPKHVVAPASGKMESKTLEKTVLSFFSGEIDVLVCTTIVESGLDITNANSIIVNNAQNFGLPQLYQIRGRVGRGKKQAHCLLLVPNKPLERDAYRRLKTIEQNTALGAGYNVSMKDLEIRGAGSLFGYRQSGHISSVGFELYCDLLRDEINKNKSNPISKQIEIQTSFSPQFDKKYIKTQTQRLDYYYRLSKAISVEELCKIETELVDSFGPLKKEALALLNIAKLKKMFSKTPIEKIFISKEKSSLYINNLDAFGSVEVFFNLMSNFKHEKLLEYRYENKKTAGLTISLITKNQYPGMKVLFSFVNFLLSKR